MYKLVALIGEAGTGKDTLLQYLVGERPNVFNEIISCTTRPIREGEKEGINYYYLTDAEFTHKIENKEMLEYTGFNGWFYGTSLDSLSTEKINIGVFNPAGIRSLLQNPEIDLKVFKVKCSDKHRLMRQLNREKNPNVDEIVRRYYADKADFSELEFEYEEINNESPSDLFQCLMKILAQL